MLTRNITNIIKQKLSDPEPILLLGARQIGKTTVALEVAKEFENHVYLNLEANVDHRRLFDGNLDPEEIVQTINFLYGSNIREGDLIIIDEIQVNSRAVTSLKYFCEHGQFKVIATGSNLGIAIFNNNSSFPVGKVTTLKMFGFSFEEYLLNSPYSNLIDLIKKAVSSKNFNPYYMKSV